MAGPGRVRTEAGATCRRPAPPVRRSTRDPCVIDGPDVERHPTAPPDSDGPAPADLTSACMDPVASLDDWGQRCQGRKRSDTALMIAARPRLWSVRQPSLIHTDRCPIGASRDFRHTRLTALRQRGPLRSGVHTAWLDRSDWHTIAGEDQRPDRYGDGRPHPSSAQSSSRSRVDGVGGQPTACLHRQFLPRQRSDPASVLGPRWWSGGPGLDPLQAGVVDGGERLSVCGVGSLVGLVALPQYPVDECEQPAFAVLVGHAGSG
jgi:hypothetical protein